VLRVSSDKLGRAWLGRARICIGAMPSLGSQPYLTRLAACMQLLKGRPPPHFALHVYHHAAVLLMG
jgi:hypothetical protein